VPGLHATGALKSNGCFAVAGWQSSTMFGIIFAPMESLIYQETPIVHLAGNTFVNVPTVLQYDQTPLIQVVRAAEAGFTTEIPIYHSDGTYLAKVVGSQIYPTADGKKAGVTLRHPERATVCELDGKTIFELIRQDAAALKTRAELYTPDGSFIKCADDNLAGYVLRPQADRLQIGGLTIIDCKFEGGRIGVWVKSDGSVSVGVA
jgi:hypothetical protein